MPQFETLKKSTVNIPTGAAFTIKEIGNTKGYDGHCLRAYTYFGNQMPDIEYTIESINGIKKKYPVLRQKSKSPTFLLTYMGTYIGLMDLGFSKKEALSIEANYHKLYQVSDEWVAAHIENAKTLGYVPLAFGGRIRTPLIAKCKPGHKMTWKQEAEARSAGNAANQSYCALTSRAANKFRERVWASPYKYKILPAAQIHDAIYNVFWNDPKIAKFINDNLIEVMAWQELPELQHPTIKISSALDIFYKNWNNTITLKNNISEKELLKACKEGKSVYLNLVKNV